MDVEEWEASEESKLGKMSNLPTYILPKEGYAIPKEKRICGIIVLATTFSNIKIKI